MCLMAYFKIIYILNAWNMISDALTCSSQLVKVSQFDLLHKLLMDILTYNYESICIYLLPVNAGLQDKY